MQVCRSIYLTCQETLATLPARDADTKQPLRHCAPLRTLGAASGFLSSPEAARVPGDTDSTSRRDELNGQNRRPTSPPRRRTTPMEARAHLASAIARAYRVVAIVYLTSCLNPQDHFRQCRSALRSSDRWHRDDVGATDNEQATPWRLTSAATAGAAFPPKRPWTPRRGRGQADIPCLTCAPARPVRGTRGTSTPSSLGIKEHHVDSDKHARDPARLG
jgi:hypothetical protein